MEWVFWLTLQCVDVYAFLLVSYLIKVVALLIFICCYHHVLVNKDIHYFSGGATPVYQVVPHEYWQLLTIPSSGSRGH